MRRFDFILFALFGLTFSTPLKAEVLEQLSSVELTSTPYAIFVESNRAYLASDESDLQIVDVTDPYNPYLLGVLDTLTNLRGWHVFAAQDIAVISQWTNGLLICDVSNPTDPFLLSIYDTDIGLAHDASIGSAGIYEALCHNLQILSIANPPQPQVISDLHLGWGTDCRCIFHRDSMIFVSDLGGQLFIIDISNLDNPQLLSSYQTAGLTEEIFVVGNYAYATCNFAGVEIIDISNPENPQQTSIIDIDMIIKKIHCSENYAFILCEASGNYHLFIYDFSNPFDPVFIYDYQTNHAADIFVNDNIVYFIARDSLTIFGFNSTDIKQPSSIPTGFSLSPSYPNPFNASTTISYSLPQPSDVRLDIYDILGRSVQTLYKGRQSAGEHSLIWDAEGFSSGMYIYKLTAGDQVQAEKMILLK